MSIHEAMAVGAGRYSDALAELGRIGSAEYTQTGGMCAALQVRLERGYLLVTDTDDSLPWDRDELRGWGVGFYPSDDASDGPEAFAAIDTPSTEALRVAVEQCLTEVATARSRG